MLFGHCKSHIVSVRVVPANEKFSEVNLCEMLWTEGKRDIYNVCQVC
jgi:hypothetical protein